jgi:NAD(P)-dependent dehydrogenase (short-subunit alcohol dehydrogenase family)
MIRRVLITAGASGIGLVMAQAFLAQGDRVWVTDIDLQTLTDMPEGIRGSRVDAADEAAMAALFASVAADWGGLDVLCANAGTKGPTAPIEEMPLDGWRDCISVSLDGAFLAAKYATPMMKSARAGAMIFTSSTAGLYGFPFRSPYAAAKWGMIGLMKSVAMELGPFGIRANAICPGGVNGPRMDAVIAAEAKTKRMKPQAVRKGYEDGAAMGRFVDAEDIANMAVFLASDGARLISGQSIAVDGFTVNPDPKV